MPLLRWHASCVCHVTGGDHRTGRQLCGCVCRRNRWSAPGTEVVLRPALSGNILGAVIGEDFASVLSAAQHGNEAAFSRLWRDANPALVRYLHVVAGQDPEDVAAETWVSVVRGLKRFRGDEAAWRAWLFTTARRRSVDEGRRRLRRIDVVMADLPEPHGSGPPDPAELVLDGLDNAAVISAIRRLPRRQAEVIMLRVVGGLPVEAVARLVGSTPGAVRVASHRGLKRLARTVIEAGVTL
jgi:RNA polymerase sigma-70 factor (ECF subfamily)